MNVVFSLVWISRFLKGMEVEWRLGRGRPSGGRDKKRMGTNVVKVHYTHACECRDETWCFIQFIDTTDNCKSMLFNIYSIKPNHINCSCNCINFKCRTIQLIMYFHLCFLMKRSNSTVELQKVGTPPPFIVKDDIDSNLKQLLYQKRKEMERQLAKQRGIFDPFIKGSLETMDESDSLKCLSFSLVEASRKAGITYIVYPRKKKKIWRKGNKFQKLGLVYEQLSKPPKKLERFCSIFMACEGYYSLGT